MSSYELQFCLGESPAVRRAMDEVEYVARSDVRVVLVGEPGTGKSTFARFLHDRSGRHGAFVSGELPALSDELVLSQLCGHRQGAFSGATSDQDGWLEFARGGTLFLDEIHLASPRVQEVLLGVLGKRTYRRLGEARERPTDVRFVFATNTDLSARARDGHLRADLLARIGCAEIALPPLRERGEDILRLATHFLRRIASAQRASRPWTISDQLARVLLSARWPGNVWDLENTCRYLGLCKQDVLLPQHLPAGFHARQLPPGSVRRVRSTTVDDVASAVSRHATKAAAARALGISRQHLHRLESRRRDSA